MSDLRRIILKGEGQHLDFKFRVDDQKKIARTLSAFANSGGGVLLIGVKDSGKVVGVNPEEEYYMIEGAATLYCKPEVSFTSRTWQEGHYLVLEIDVAASDLKHRSPDEDGKWRHFVRVDDHTLRGNKILERVWNLQLKGLDRPVHFDDATRSLIDIIRQEGESTISKIYRRSDLKMSEVDRILASLVYWQVIRMDMSEAGTTYQLEEI